MILGKRENGTESYTLLARKTYLSINRLINKKVVRDKAIKLINDLLYIETWTLSQKLRSRSMYTTLCKGTVGQKERNILQTSDVRWTDRLITLGCLQSRALYIQVSCAVSQTHNGSHNAYHKARQYMYHLPTVQFQSIHFGQIFLLQPSLCAKWVKLILPLKWHLLIEFCF